MCHCSILLKPEFVLLTVSGQPQLFSKKYEPIIPTIDISHQTVTSGWSLMIVIRVSLRPECFTRVVKGHIAVVSAVFPRLTKGQMLDTLARRFLWEVGLDYSHSTGHGVGAYLNVHEGPVGISWKNNPDDPGLQEGMILSAGNCNY
ncbi:xaa-Pro aminopeptidase ApepP-like [Centruroides sculpturatus]|uniref:xaa-Pro aminopeptidase ApepP-like n=1 Tax=Centruroides sculpturatus TaxID=218467 RepID=UPI000C6CDCE4|nr:xaa-Pro aminopeptidase ApepP-like [Centruroides sculpturatus]